MMHKKRLLAAAAALLLVSPALAASDPDARQKVELPEMMKQHMLRNMRDHLAALHDIQVALARGELDQAATIAEQRIGMSSLASHSAAHMAPYMPKPMQDIGAAMHHAASRFALTATEGDALKAMDSLSKVTEQCIACHAAYRVN
jgi:hypothetical protein